MDNIKKYSNLLFLQILNFNTYCSCIRDGNKKEENNKKKQVNPQLEENDNKKEKDNKEDNEEKISLIKECKELIKEINAHNKEFTLEIKEDEPIKDIKDKKKQTLVDLIQTIKTKLESEIKSLLEDFKKLGKNIENIDYKNKTIKEIIEFKVKLENDLEKEKQNIFNAIQNKLRKIKDIEKICGKTIYNKEVKKDDKLDDLIKKNNELDNIYSGKLEEVFKVYDECNDEEFLKEISVWVHDITFYKLYHRNGLRNFSKLFSYECEYEKPTYGSTKVKSIKFICKDSDNEEMIEKLYCASFEKSREKSKEKGDDNFSKVPYCDLIEFIERYDMGEYEK